MDVPDSEERLKKMKVIGSPNVYLPEDEDEEDDDDFEPPDSEDSLL
jgi:hypothetical protein